MSAKTTAVPILLLLAAGCSHGGYRVAPVSGKVVIDGRPAAGVHVEYLPVGGPDNPNPGPGSIGITDDQGVYVLNCVQTREAGAVVGPHRVQINRRLGADEDEVDLVLGRVKKDKTRPKQLPAKYNSESTLTIDVPAAGTDMADFDVVTK